MKSIEAGQPGPEPPKVLIVSDEDDVPPHQVSRRGIMVGATALVALAAVGIDLSQPLSAQAVGRFVWPFPLSLVFKEYGPRDFAADDFHKGIDFGKGVANVIGTPVISSATGTVSAASSSPGFGNYVRVEHGDGLSTEYHHLNARSVVPGQAVSQGQQLGTVGNTGLTTGVHLHFQTNVNGQHVNPRLFMDAHANQGGTTMTPEQATMLLNIYNAIFYGGPSMPDANKSIGRSLADVWNKPIQRTVNGQTVQISALQELADAKTEILAVKAQVAQILAKVNTL